jgi:hypothetical protein
MKGCGFVFLFPIPYFLFPIPYFHRQYECAPSLTFPLKIQ